MAGSEQAGASSEAPTDVPAASAEPSASPTPCPEPAACYREPEVAGSFDATAVPEASGLAASHANDGVLYLLDDAPGTTVVHAVDLGGTAVTALEISGMDTRDGESLATGPCGLERPQVWCLYVGDIGDNARSRGDVVVHRVPEPDLSAGPPPGPLAADAARLSYPDGPHDAEALLVDATGRVHLVTKAPFERSTQTTGETRLYRAETFADGVLTDLGPVDLPAPAAPFHSRVVGGGVTGGDLQGGRLLLRTYDAVQAFIAPDGGEDLAALDKWRVVELPSALEPQSEALAIAADGCSYYTVGEAVGEIWRVPWSGPVGAC